MSIRTAEKRRADMAMVGRTIFALVAIIAVLLVALFALVATAAAQPIFEDDSCVSGERQLRVFASGRTEPGLCVSAPGVYSLETGESIQLETVAERSCGARIDDPHFVEKMIDHFGLEWRVVEHRWGDRGYWFVPTAGALSTGFWCVTEREDWNFGLGRWSE